MKTSVIGSFILFAIYVCTLNAQDVTGNLEGRILDKQGNPVPGVTITATSPSLQGQRGTSSGNDGIFRLLWLPGGRYALKLSHVAYQPKMVDDVTVRLGRTSTMGDITLEEGTVGLNEVVISGDRPMIDATSTTTGANLDAAAIEPLPTDRSFRSIMTLAPQANKSYLGDETNISGSTGSENVYFIDGINSTDVLAAKTSTDLPYNFVKEIEVKTGGYEAEYASALGGVMNVVTRSGGNEIHGQAFGFFTNSSLSAEPKVGYMGTSEKKVTTYDAGLSLGGPILEDKLWYFFAYNPNFQNKDIDIAGLGIYTDRKQAHLFAGKLSWQPSQSTNLTLSVLGDPATQDLVNTSGWFFSGVTALNPDPLLRKLSTGGVTGSLLARQMVSDRFFIEASFSMYKRKEVDNPRTEAGSTELLIVDYVAGTLSGGFPYSINSHTTRFSGQINGSLFLGAHTLKAGLGYEDNGVKTYWHSLMGAAVPFDVIRRGESDYMSSNSEKNAGVHNRIPSVFLQDSWLAYERLRLNAGLRATSEYFIGGNGNLAQRITGELQPRLGFTFQPGEMGSKKVFGSYGRFYEQIPLALSNAFHSPYTFVYDIFYDHDPRVDPTGGDTVRYQSTIIPEVNGLEGQHFDEFILGYEQRVWDEYKVGVRGIYRNLLQVVEDGYDTTTLGEGYVGSVIGNPGEGPLSFLPRFTRQYKAVEITLERSSRTGLNFLLSYVLSRTYGNYPGLYSSDYRANNVNVSPFDTPEQALNSDGLLPNDRTHVFKFSGSYPFGFGLTAGTSLFIQSGTPLNEFGMSAIYEYVYLKPRGTVGRTPTIWDLNLRLTYDFSAFLGTSLRPKVIMDLFHLFSQREAVDFDQVAYLNRDEFGNQTDPNPSYGQPVTYQPPMMLRLGMQVDF